MPDVEIVTENLVEQFVRMLEDDVFFADIDAGETKFVRHTGHRAHVCIRDGGADDSFLADEAVGAIGRHIAVDEVLDGMSVEERLEAAEQVYKNRMIRISTARLNEEMLPLIEAYPPPSIKGKYIKIKYCTQLPNTQIPSFVFFANLPQYVKEPYRRFLENKMRERWSLSGTPINIFLRQK